MKARGVGYGKIILFGEHFVVYGREGIVAGLKDLRTIVEIKESKQFKILNKGWDNSIVIRALKNIIEELGIEKEFEVKVVESVPPKKNLGSSSSFCVAFTRALNNLYSLNMKEDTINKLAYLGEKAFHGTPSGIDNTASTFGTILKFKKEDEDLTYKIISIKNPLPLLIIPSNEEKKGTRELVMQFRRIMKSESTYEKLFEVYDALFKRAIDYIKKGNKEGLGNLMNLNHSLLASFDLSTPKIEKIREKLKKEGAIGSKITGAGKGGNIIALFKNAKKAKEVAKKYGARFVEIK